LKSTRQAARSNEFFYSMLFDRQTPEKWAEAGRPTIYTYARQKVDEILAGPMIDPLPQSVEAELASILETANRELAHKD
jgi:trimethylamine:corrinoid methyltransferase-like protein